MAPQLTTIHLANFHSGGPEDDKRYVSYTAYKGAVEHDIVLRLHASGCLYGQKCASKQFYCTLATWLCDNGFKQAKNDPCLFVNEAGGWVYDQMSTNGQKRIVISS